MVLALFVECERLVFGQGLIERFAHERMMGARVHQSQATGKTRVDDLPGPLDIDGIHHGVFFRAQVDLGSKVINDIHTLDRAADVFGIEDRARHELDVEAGEGLRQGAGLQHTHLLAVV